MENFSAINPVVRRSLKKNSLGGGASPSRLHGRGLTCHWNRNIMRDLGQKMTTSDHWNYILTFWRSKWSLTLADPTYLPTVQWPNWGFLDFLSWDRVCGYFLHKPVYSAPSSFQDNWASLHKAILCGNGDAVPFRDALRHKYWLRILYQNVIFYKTKRETRWRMFYVTLYYSIWI